MPRGHTRLALVLDLKLNLLGPVRGHHGPPRLARFFVYHPPFR